MGTFMESLVRGGAARKRQGRASGDFISEVIHGIKLRAFLQSRSIAEPSAPRRATGEHVNQCNALKTHMHRHMVPGAVVAILDDATVGSMGCVEA
jgi:hypothetical protein